MFMFVGRRDGMARNTREGQDGMSGAATDSAWATMEESPRGEVNGGRIGGEERLGAERVGWRAASWIDPQSNYLNLMCKLASIILQLL